MVRTEANWIREGRAHQSLSSTARSYFCDLQPGVFISLRDLKNYYNPSMKKHVLVIVTIIMKFTEEYSLLKVKHRSESFGWGYASVGRVLACVNEVLGSSLSTMCNGCDGTY